MLKNNFNLFVFTYSAFKHKIDDIGVVEAHDEPVGNDQNNRECVRSDNYYFIFVCKNWKRVL